MIDLFQHMFKNLLRIQRYTTLLIIILYCKMIYTNFMNGLINGYFHLTLTNVAYYTMANIIICTTIVQIITGLMLIAL